MPTLGQLFGTWEEEVWSRYTNESPRLRSPQPLAAPMPAHSGAAVAAENMFSRAHGSQSTYDLQNARRFLSVALNQVDPYSLEAGAIRRRRLAVESALRARCASGEAERYDPRDTQRLYDALGIRPRRRRPEEEDFEDAGDDAGFGEFGGGE